MDDTVDVVIVELKTMKIYTFAGQKMSRSDGFYNAEKRLKTVEERSNTLYAGVIVPTGKYQVGDIVESNDRP